MAAPLGFKTFTTGEVLTAADTNGYLLQEQRQSHRHKKVKAHILKTQMLYKFIQDQLG